MSNRLPYGVRVEGDSLRLVPAAGGVATGLRPWHEQPDGLWIGWRGDLLGFNTFAYLRHFVASLLHVSGVEADIDQVCLDGREIRHGVYPMEVERGLAASRPTSKVGVTSIPPAPLAAVLSAASRDRPIRLLLDYDGTLVPLARSPELAAPDAELMTLLEALTCCPWLEPAIVSGRSHQSLEAWFGHLPLVLWAEHGFWHRPSPQASWAPAAPVDVDWTKKLLPILQHFTDRTPGSRIELKSATVAWHFRGAQREFGARQAHELRMLLGDALSNQPLEVLEGRKVIEVRFRGISKAVVAHENASDREHRLTVAFGDDQTDEDLFRALPDTSITVAVGPALASARYRVTDYRAVRQLLRLLAAPAAAQGGLLELAGGTL